jgi:hypothetical protein
MSVVSTRRQATEAEPREENEKSLVKESKLSVINPAKIKIADHLTDSAEESCVICLNHRKVLMNVKCSHLTLCFQCADAMETEKDKQKQVVECCFCGTRVSAWQVVLV